MDRYEEALERAKAGKPMDEVFPELKESEDERIRKWLVELVKNTDTNHSNIKLSENCKLALAYLEKQKWQKPAILKPHKGDGGNPYDMGVSEAQEYAIKRGFGIPFNDGEVFVDERYITQTIGNILRWADEHPKEQKPNIELIQRSWYMEGYHDREFGQEPKWVIKTGEGGPKYEKNEKYGQPLEQKPAEWSEENENKIESIKGLITTGRFVDTNTIRTIWKLLDSLRPQPHWKPSDQ